MPARGGSLTAARPCRRRASERLHGPAGPCVGQGRLGGAYLAFRRSTASRAGTTGRPGIFRKGRGGRAGRRHPKRRSGLSLLSWRRQEPRLSRSRRTADSLARRTASIVPGRQSERHTICTYHDHGGQRTQGRRHRRARRLFLGSRRNSPQLRAAERVALQGSQRGVF